MKFQEKSEDTRNFVKLKSGESIVGVFRGDLYEFRTHWGDNRAVLCPGDGCSICATGKKPTFRFRVNFIIKESQKDNPGSSVYVAKVLEMGWNFYDELRMLNEEYNPIESHAIKITRQGEKLATKYSILPVANGAITPDKEKELSAVILNNLGHLTDQENEPATQDESNSYPDIPF